MRKISQGSDGWYFESKKIEPTEDEIKAWYDRFCDYCSMGSILPKKGTISEQCDRQVPCPVCNGTGMKEDSRYFKYALNGKVLSVSKPMLDAEEFHVFKRIVVQFDWAEPSQEDGRPPKPLYKQYAKMLNIGKAISIAIKEYNNCEIAKRNELV